jgi:predicted RNA binding protein YcfA (HicA-like mRNA interferase family)
LPPSPPSSSPWSWRRRTPRLRRLSGAELLRIFRGFGFTLHSERAAHIKLRRTHADGTTETLTILHLEVKLGTVREIFTQAARFLPEADLRPHFYTN